MRYLISVTLAESGAGRHQPRAARTQPATPALLTDS